MPKHPMGAARFVLAWERRMIRNGRAWRKPNPNGPTTEGRSTFTWLAPPKWTRHVDRYNAATVRWVPGPLVSVPQSTLAVRPDGCTCDYYVHGNHASWPGGCPVYVPPEPAPCVTCGSPPPCHYHDPEGNPRSLKELETRADLPRREETRVCER